MTPPDPSINATSAGPSRLTARTTGVLVAVVVVVGLLGLAVMRPFGIGGPTVLERPDWILGLVLVAGGLGCAGGRTAASTGWPWAMASGALVGLAVYPVLVVLGSLVATLDAVIRGGIDPLNGVGAGAAWVAYGLVVIGALVSIVTVPSGVVWGVLTWTITRGGRLGLGSRSVWARLLMGFAAVAVLGGASQASLAQPAAAVCRPVGSGHAVDAAFSPAGDLLAVATSTDPNLLGTVVLIRWPSGEELGRWRAWIDQEVAVSPAGDVYWPAWYLGSNFEDAKGISEGVYVARRGTEPDWFATGGETPLNDLTWTARGLRGTTPNSHLVAVVEQGATGPSIEGPEVGAFWSSSDADWTVSVPTFDTTFADVAGPGEHVHVPVPGNPRSIGLTSDRSTIIAADWFGGARSVDVATGSSRLLIRGSQRFIALSPRGDLAWANDDNVGRAELCTARLADL